MTRTLTILSILAFAACAPSEDKPPQVDPATLKTTPQNVPTASPPSLSAMRVAATDAYCRFMDAEHVLDEADPETWDFLLLTEWPPTGEPANEFPARVKINGTEYVLPFKGQEDAKTGGWTRWYESADTTYMIEVVAETAADEGEAIAYTGTIRVVSPLAGQAVRFKGVCGG